jgi:hypothetical protein
MMHAKKKVIIVPNDKMNMPAHLLKALISSKDDSENESVGTRDGEVEAVIWDDKHYEANKHSLSSEQKIVFLGLSKKTEQDVNALQYFHVDEKFGIDIYVSGNYAAILVNDRDTTDDEYEQFYEYCKINDKKIQEKVDTTQEDSAKTRSTNWLGTLLQPAAIVGSYAQSMVKHYGNQKKILEQKRTASVQIFYLLHMREFMDS